MAIIGEEILGPDGQRYWIDLRPDPFVNADYYELWTDATGTAGLVAVSTDPWTRAEATRWSDNPDDGHDPTIMVRRQGGVIMRWDEFLLWMLGQFNAWLRDRFDGVDPAPQFATDKIRAALEGQVVVEDDGTGDARWTWPEDPNA